MNDILHYFSNLFSSEGFPARWFCGQWTPFAGWFYIFSDLAIWGAYFAIPIILLYFIRKRSDIPFPRIFWLFAAFIFACGTTHLFDAIMFWWPAYRLSGLVYFWTAVVSWVTVSALIPIIPKALTLKSPTQLEKIVEEKTLALTQSEERWRQLANTVPSFVWTATPDGAINFLNDRWYEFSGLTPEESVGYGWASTLHPDDNNCLKTWAEAIKNETPYEEEVRFRNRVGAYFWMIVRAVPIRDSRGKVEAWYGTGSNIEDLKKSQQESQTANHKKSEFLALMSHELRTPLNSIIGYSRMIEKGMAGPLTEDQTLYIQNVGTSSNHLLNIVNDLLDISRVEAGKMVIFPKRFELQPVMDNIQSMMLPVAAKKQISLSFEIQPDVDSIEADPDRFQQILINLISNAIKFNKEGGSVQVCLRKSEDNKWLIAEVQDSGVGIPEGKQKDLFSKFYQADASASRHHEGTGLGLALSKELIEMHHGEISFESKEGTGSTFTFRLPS